MSQNYSPLAGTDLFAASYGKLNGSIEAAATWFIGSTAPVVFPGRPWIDTLNDEIKLGNEAGDGWILLGKYGTAYLASLPIAGGTMTGPLNMGGQLITNLALGSGLAAARQQEVDLKAPLAAPVFTGDARVSQDPTGNDSIPRRSWTEARYVKLSGGSLTGQLTMSAYAGGAYQVVVLEQLQNFLGFNVTAGHRHDGADARKIRGSDLDSGAAVVGTALMAQGSGASAFQALQQTPMRFIDDPTLAVNIPNGNSISSSWTTVDLASVTDADTYAAIVRVRATLDSSHTLRVRKNGSSTDGSNQNIAPENGGAFSSDPWSTTVIVELDSSRRFQYRASPSSVLGELKMNLIGYMRKNF